MVNKIVNKTLVKTFLQEKELRIGGDVMDTLQEIVHKKLSDASNRAKKNNRKTLFSHDL